MAISYRVIKRKIPSGPEKGRIKYFGKPVRSKLISYKQLCNRIMVQSSATRGDVSLILQNFIDALIEYLQDGNSVLLPELGTFRITAGSEGTDQEEDFTAHLMKPPRVNFLPCSELRVQIARLKFEKDNPLIKYIEEECTLPHG